MYLPENEEHIQLIQLYAERFTIHTPFIKEGLKDTEATSCEQSTKPSGSTESGEFLEYLSDY
jgi:hypothetical protein